MRPRTIVLGSCILAVVGLVAFVLFQPGVPAPAAAPPPIHQIPDHIIDPPPVQVPGIPTVIQVAPGAPVPGPVLNVLPPLPVIDPPPVDKPKVEKPVPVPPKEAIQKPACQPSCQPVYCPPVYCRPRCWSWRRYR